MLVGRLDLQHVPGRVSHVIFHLAAVIQVHAEPPVPAVHQQEIVGAVEGDFVLGVVGFIGAVAYIAPAALVDAPDGFTQAVDLVALCQLVLPAAGTAQQIGNWARFQGNLLDNAVGGQRGTESIMQEHFFIPPI